MRKHTTGISCTRVFVHRRVLKSGFISHRQADRLTVVVGELQVVEVRGQEVLERSISASSGGQFHGAVLLAVQQLHVVI